MGNRAIWPSWSQLPLFPSPFANDLIIGLETRGKQLAEEPKSRNVRAGKFLAQKLLTLGAGDKSCKAHVCRRGKMSPLRVKLTSLLLGDLRLSASREKKKKAGLRERSFSNGTHFLSHLGLNTHKMLSLFFFACFDTLTNK